MATATKKRVAIIGAGPSGLSALHAFATAQRKGAVSEADAPELVCFERQGNWGGQWNFSWRVGTDDTGEPVHSSMYRYLWSNGPKECLEFSDYSFEEHFGKAIPSYPPRAVLADYVLGRAKKSGIRKHIRFNTAVRWIQPRTEGGFEVSYTDLTADRSTTEVFSHVIVATGHFWSPHTPSFEGINDFAGSIIHAHDFRRAEAYTGKRVLIVGASYSAEDIGLQLMKYGAKSVTMSYRTKAQGFDWPEGMEELPLINKFDGSHTVQFSNGESRDFDAVILCTGYKHSFPFLHDALKLRTVNRLYSPGLFKGVVWHTNPDLFYVGMQDQWYTFTMFDAEAWYARDVILGAVELPSEDKRAADMAAWTAKEEALETAYDLIDFQAEYVDELMKHTDYPKFDLQRTRDEFRAWKKNKQANIVTYRDQQHTSAVTGNKQPVHHTPWWEALDDTLPTYLATKD